MSIVKNLTSMDQRIEQPGIYLLADSPMTFGIKPRCHEDGHELIPFEWATEFPPVAEFVQRFPQHWRANKVSEFWTGGEFNPVGVYWCRYDPRSLGGTL
jgi:hypothetical protein